MPHDVIVIGGGVSGLSFAYHAARDGRSVLVVEKSPRPGGCVHTYTGESGGFWIELGAHTCYNSYGATIELLEGLGLMGELQRRGKPVLRFVRGDDVLPGKNLGALLRRMSLWEAMTSLPRALGKKPQGESVRSYYSRFVGPENYRRVLGPMLSAVPSQRADDFPADMLFKKRPRRKDVLRSYTLKQGLGQIVTALAAAPGVKVTAGRAAARLTPGWKVTLDDGAVEEAPIVALAVPPAAAAALLRDALPAAAEPIASMREASVDSVGVVVRADRVQLPYATFFIPTEADAFHSVVTRDVVPDATWRGFAFHFQPGLAPDERLARIARFLRVGRLDLEMVAARRSTVPSPVVGHAAAVRAVDAALQGQSLAIAGNWFAGLAMEDCVQRSRAEWRRLAYG